MTTNGDEERPSDPSVSEMEVENLPPFETAGTDLPALAIEQTVDVPLTETAASMLVNLGAFLGDVGLIMRQEKDGGLTPQQTNDRKDSKDALRAKLEALWRDVLRLPENTAARRAAMHELIKRLAIASTNLKLCDPNNETKGELKSFLDQFNTGWPPPLRPPC